MLEVIQVLLSALLAKEILLWKTNLQQEQVCTLVKTARELLNQWMQSTLFLLRKLNKINNYNDFNNI